ncbi:MAG: BUD32 family EKC/KEOPS complex subunit [Planctomycetota bacterium]
MWHDEDRDLVVKTWPLTPALLLELMLGVGQPQRQVRGAALTRRAGIDTPARRGRYRLSRHGLRPVIELRHEHVAGETALLVACEGRAAEVSWLADACGRLVRLYRLAGVFHRDLKLDNLIVESDRRRLWLVDTVGVRRQRDPLIETARMLERLDVQLRERRATVSLSLRLAAMRAALQGLSGPQRRAVLRHLRERPPP